MPLRRLSAKSEEEASAIAQRERRATLALAWDTMDEAARAALSEGERALFRRCSEEQAPGARGDGQTGTATLDDGNWRWVVESSKGGWLVSELCRSDQGCEYVLVRRIPAKSEAEAAAIARWARRETLALAWEAMTQAEREALPLAARVRFLRMKAERDALPPRSRQVGEPDGARLPTQGPIDPADPISSWVPSSLAGRIGIALWMCASFVAGFLQSRTLYGAALTMALNSALLVGSIRLMLRARRWWSRRRK